MIKKIALCHQHRRFIQRRRSFSFVGGFNVVIGPNGSGKSSLLQAIMRCKQCERQQDLPTHLHYFNGETMNPHRFDRHFKGLSGSVIRVRALFSSHGETLRDVLRSYQIKPGHCFILDEPEMGQDIGWIVKIRKGLDQLVRAGCQVIVASHHPVFWREGHLVELKRDYFQQSCRLMKRSISAECLIE
jgi:predicted ATPase